MSLAEKMTPVYAALVRAGLRTLEQVPEAIRPQVKILLEGGTP